MLYKLLASLLKWYTNTRDHERRVCGGPGDSGRKEDCCGENLENWLEVVRFAILVFILGLVAPSVAISLSEL